MNQTVFKEKQPIRLHTLLLMLYFFLAPLEDLVTGQFGTVAKYIAILIVAAGFLEYEFNLKFSLTKANLCMLWLIALSVLSCVWAIDFDTAIGRISAYVTVPGICLFVSMLDFSEDEYNSIVSAAILGGLVAVAYVVISNGPELLLSGRITLNENNDPNNLAALLLLPLGLSIGRLLTVKEKIPKILNIVSLSIISFLLLLTGSRGGLLGLLAFFAAYLIFTKAYRKFSALLGVLIILAVIWLIVVPKLPEDIYNRFFNNNDFIGEDATGSGRTIIWETLLTKIVPENFIIGIGAGCSPVALSRFYGRLKGVHNTYFNMLAEFGVLGLPAFIIMLYNRWSEQYKAKKYIEASLLIGICVIIFFLDSYAKKFFWNVIMLLIISEKVHKNDDIAVK